MVSEIAVGLEMALKWSWQSFLGSNNKQQLIGHRPRDYTSDDRAKDGAAMVAGHHAEEGVKLDNLFPSKTLLDGNNGVLGHHDAI